MKKTSIKIIFSISGFFIGIMFAGILMWKMGPSMMLLEDESAYTFEETIKIYNEAVLAKGWKIPTVHDLQETMKKYGKNVSRVTVFELCHPDHAYEILSRNNEKIVSAMMPCRVSFYEKEDGKVYVSRMNSELMGNMMGGIIAKTMKIASQETEEILKTILK